jgi:D-methionine transport system permease protein
MSPTLLYDLFIATGETLYMVLFSTLLATLLGLPLGTLLFCSEKITPYPTLARVLHALVNVTRSIPFIILLVAIIPLTRIIAGTSIGLNAAIVPLSLGATPFIARLIHNVLISVPEGLIETGLSLGATPFQMIRHIIFPEIFPQMIQTITLTAITLVNYSAMAGTVGAGGLGDLAIRYGYQRFNPVIMCLTVAVLVLIVQIFQLMGDRLAHYYSPQKNRNSSR